MQLSSKFLARVLLLMVVINNTSGQWASVAKEVGKAAITYAISEGTEKFCDKIQETIKTKIVSSISNFVKKIPEKVRSYVEKVKDLFHSFTQNGPTEEEVESAHYYNIVNDAAESIPKSERTISKGTKTDTTQLAKIITDGNSQNLQRNISTLSEGDRIIDTLTKHIDSGFDTFEKKIRQKFDESSQVIKEAFITFKKNEDKNRLALEQFIDTTQKEEKLDSFYLYWDNLIDSHDSNVKKYLDYLSESENIDDLKNTEQAILSLPDNVDGFVKKHMTIYNRIGGNPTFFSIIGDLLNAQEARVCQSKGAQWRIYEEFLKIIIKISDIMNFIIHVKINKFNRENNQFNISFDYEKKKLETLQEGLEIYQLWTKNMYEVAIDAYKAINRVSSVIRTCDPIKPVKDVTYQNFVRIQQGYIGSMDPEDPDDPFIEIEKNQYSTWVSVTNCTKLDEAIIFSESPTTQNMERYFDYAVEKEIVYGTDDRNKKYVSTQIRGDNVQKCIMKYEDEFSEHSIRFVSLQPKTTFPNYFVTGIRLKITNQILHLEIQQGKMSNGQIVNNTIHWLPSSKQTIYDKTMLVDVSKIKGFFMKDVTLPDGNFLTGVKFEVYNYKNDKKEEIQLIEIIVQGQNLTTQFNVSKENWLKGPNTQSLKEINLHNSDSSIKANSNVVMSTPGQHYIPIQVTSMEKDAAQSMIPYLDIQNLYAPGLMPFRGIGMYYRGSEGFGGFIGLNAFGHKISDLINIENLKEGWDTAKNLIVFVNDKKQSLKEKIKRVNAEKKKLIESVSKKIKETK